MRSLLLFVCLCFSFVLFAQPDTVRLREPGLQTSFEKHGLLIIALLGLLLLIGLRFWFWRRRRNQ